MPSFTRLPDGELPAAMRMANANAALWAIGNGLISTLLVIYLASGLGATGEPIDGASWLPGVLGLVGAVGLLVIVVTLLAPDPAPPPGLEGYSAIERLGLEVSAAQMRQAQADTPLRRMPLMVLSHSRTLPNPFGFPPDWPVEALERAFQASQDRLATLVPGARHVIAKRSGHYIQLDQPRLVTREIRRVVQVARIR